MARVRAFLRQLAGVERVVGMSRDGVVELWVRIDPAQTNLGAVVAQARAALQADPHNHQPVLVALEPPGINLAAAMVRLASR